MKRYVGLLVGLVAFAGSIAVSGVVEAGGGGHYVSGTSSPVSYQEVGYTEVAITDNCFGPVVAHVAPGAQVRWINKGNALHNVADVTKPTMQPSMLQSGATLSMKFNDPGAFIYHCSIHPGMMGVLFVGDVASQDSNPELVASGTSASVLPPKVAPPEPAILTAPASTREGMAAQTVILLAMFVGLLAGGGSTLLVRRLDSRK